MYQPGATNGIDFSIGPYDMNRSVADEQLGFVPAPFPYLTARIFDQSGDIAVVSTPGINAGDGYSFDRVLSVCMGFAQASGGVGQLKLYAYVRQFKTGVRFGTPDFGSGTLSMVCDANQQTAFSGAPEVQGSSLCVGLRLEQFIKTLPCLPELRTVRQQRAGSMVASHKSRCLRFSQFISAVNTGQAPMSLAQVDCGGHDELFGFTAEEKLAVFLNGQPDENVAWLPDPGNPRSDCAFTENQNIRLKKLSLELNDLPLTGLPAWAKVDDVPIEGECGQFGNNEYTGVNDNAITWNNTIDRGFGPETQTVAVSKVWAFVRLSGYEEVEDTTTQNINSVVCTYQLRITVDIMAPLQDDPESDPSGTIFVQRVSKLLTEAEAISFFDGTPVTILASEMDGPSAGTVVVSAVGV
jgi:hypothetical protein